MYTSQFEKLLRGPKIRQRSLFCQKSSFHEAHAVENEGDKMRDHKTNSSAADHVAEHFGVLGVHNLSVLMPLGMIEIV